MRRAFEQARHHPNAAIYTLVQPNICVIREPGKIEPRNCLSQPGLIIKVTSPGTAAHDWKAKFDLYEEVK